MMNWTVRNMLNKPYTIEGDEDIRTICWHFCRKVYSTLGMELPVTHHEHLLNKLATPVVPCIVLLRIAGRWHSGVVWPDGLHFIHVCFDAGSQEYIVRKDRLTAWPYRLLIEGFYGN